MTDQERAAMQQALEALLTPGGAQACSTCQNGPENEYCCRREMWSAVDALRAALAQQAESPCACWPGRMCSRQAQCAATVRAQQAEPVASLNAWAEQRLARHGIPMPETPRCHYPNCVGGKQGTICHDSCPGGNPSFG